ncbi:MAG: VCBS repeat-containing protein, partial [Verrucomicrobiota bacterium]
MADRVLWWENQNGTGTSWAAHNVDNAFQGAFSVHAADMDDDGDIDILGAARDADDIAWWENLDGSGTSWNKHTVEADFDGARAVGAPPHDGARAHDNLAGAGDDHEVAWWENSDGSGTHLIRHLVDASFAGVSGLHAADLDDDGDQDIIGAAWTDNEVAFWLNPGGPGTNWTQHTLSSSFNGAFSVSTADVDGDGHLDILGSAYTGDTMAWWENPGPGSVWDQHLLPGVADGASSLIAADLDLDGHLDLLGTAYVDREILWWQNPDGTGTNLIRRVLNGSFNGAGSLAATDLDGDGDTDLLAAARVDDDVAWWANASTLIAGFAPGISTNLIEDSTTVVCYVADSVVSNGTSRSICTGWTRTGSQPGSGTNGTTGPFDLTTDTTISFTWEQEFRLDLTVVGQGNVDRTSGWHRDGEDVTLTAAPFPNGSFLGWQGEVPPGAENANPLVLTMDQARSVTARFTLPRFDVVVHNPFGSAFLRTETTAFGNEMRVSGNFDGARSVSAADVDGDGDQDLLGAADVADRILWWENLDGGGSNWSAHAVHNNFSGAFSVQGADINGDGYTDLLGAAR